MSNDPHMRITENRQQSKWTGREKILRVLWAAVQPIFRFSPRPLWGTRCVLLRLFGARIGHHVQIYPTVRIQIPWNLSIGNFSAIGDRAELYCLGPVRIGTEVTVSQYAYLCAGTHDHLDPAMPLLKVPITIKSAVWICAGAFIGPGVEIGEGAVIGARAVVTKPVEPWQVVAGNPARAIKKRQLRCVE